MATDADRWKKLMALVGSPQNGSDEIVKLYWDDATMTPFITIDHGDLYKSVLYRAWLS